MKKSTKTVWIVLLIAFLVLAIASVAGILIFKPFATIPLYSDLGNCKGGWTTFSIDDVDIVGTGNRIRIYGVAKGSECMQIAFTPEQLNGYLDGYKATKPIYGSIKLLSYTKTFPVDPTNRCFKTVEIDSDTSLTHLCNVDNCKTLWNHPTAFDASRPFIGYNCRCYYTGCQGYDGSFSASRDYGNFDILFQIGTETTHLTRGQQSAVLAGGKGYLEWTGNLDNLDKVGVPQYDAKLIGSKWYLVEDGAYSDVESEFQKYKSCGTTIPSCRSTFNTNTQAILQDKTPKYKSDMSALIYDVNSDSNAFEVSLKAPPFPTFILDLDATWVGIVPLQGKPKITQCIPSQSLTSGFPKTVNFKVKNEANVNGVSFYGTVSCTKGATGYLPGFSMDANQEKSITAELIPNNPNPGTVTGTCTLTVKDLKSSNSDSCSFSVSTTYNSGITCQPGSFRCSDDLKNLLKCSSDGKNYESYQSCDFGCEYISGSARCKSQENCENDIDDDGDGLVDSKDPDCSVNESAFCSDCFSWLYGKAKSGYCKPSSVWEFKAGQIIGWNAGPTILKISQDSFCPLFLLLFAGVTAMIIMIINQVYQNSKLNQIKRKK